LPLTTERCAERSTLLSDEARFVTGATLSMDGGVTAG
jgi:hypothetical protein